MESSDSVGARGHRPRRADRPQMRSKVARLVQTMGNLAAQEKNITLGEYVEQLIIEDCKKTLDEELYNYYIGRLEKEALQ